MKTLHIEDWKFSLTNPIDPWAPGFDDKSWQDVIVPHDWAVTFPFSRANSSGTGYLPGGTGWYRTRFTAPPSFTGKNETAFINFDGVYKNSQVWCNGYYLGLRPSGYSAFSYDISHCVHPGDDNVIAVKVTHEDIADSRWYTGSGIYRRVTVDFHDTAYIPPRSIVVKTDVSGEKALVRVSAEIRSPTPLEKGLLAVSLTEKGAAINTTGAGPNAAVFSKESIQLGNFTPGDTAGTSRYHIEAEIEVPRPRLWSPESPYLYTLIIEGTAQHEDGHISRISPEPLNIGIRTIKFDPDRGFFINGESQKLKGVCVHHDAGCLGAAVRPGVWSRRLEKLNFQSSMCSVFMNKSYPSGGFLSMLF
ncbi:hypothetical protein FACS189461_4120 [Spirochaetia bacterium]|nr:hypothetical protein FACS189461_4120 [Spirochaetia bacterium]